MGFISKNTSPQLIFMDFVGVLGITSFPKWEVRVFSPCLLHSSSSLKQGL
jgi:hypothetical protein